MKVPGPSSPAQVGSRLELWDRLVEGSARSFVVDRAKPGSEGDNPEMAIPRSTKTRQRIIGTVSAAASCAVVLAAAPLPAAHAEASASAGGAASSISSDARPAHTSEAPPEERVRGLIVKTATTAVSVLGLASASEASLSDASAPTRVGIGPAIAPRTRVLKFSEPVTLDQAQMAASRLQARSDVVWAVPDRLMRPTVAPVIPNDPLFDQQWDVWDPSRPDGGYGVKAPLIWGKTSGRSSIVVAVIDTGITAHPDLDANVVAGYDFISDVDVSNDGDARDLDPADPGDWVTDAESAYGPLEGCEAVDSSWHGTHVAGTIAAVRGNSVGISGVAPGVRIQPLRALGKCGGYVSDIVAAMRWAAGGDVPGVPANSTPAKVINLSLGGAGECSEAEQEAVNYARSRNVTVVVAAGNEELPVSMASPANCAGTVAVAATARDGGRAFYSNYGESPGAITLAAPGGDSTRDSEILSTYNSGTRSPLAPTYAALQGTSMAAPHVAAAAALAYSLGATTADQVKEALIAAIQPFPSGVPNACTTITCGAGILDLTALVGPGPIAPAAPSGVAAVPADRSATVTWVAPEETGGSPITSYTATAQPGGAVCTTAALTCTISGLENGSSYSITVTATNADGATSQTSTPVTVTPEAPPLPPGAVSDVTVSWRKVNRSYTATLRWTAPVGFPDVAYRARLAPVGGTYGAWSDLEGALLRITDLRAGRGYRVQIQAGNDVGWGTSRVVRLLP